MAGATLVLSVLGLALGGGARDAGLALWAVLGAVAVTDVVLSRIRREELSVDMPAEVFVGEEAKLVLRLASPRDALRARIDWPEGLDGPVDIAFIPFKGVMVAAVPARAVRRGAWQVQHLWLHWPTRFGLFECVPKLAMNLTVKVVPNIRLVQSGQITSTVVSTLYGVKENRAVGEGSEFHQLRDFVAGMDIKTIDWKRSAKKRSLVAKELRAERNHHVIIALDNGYLMREDVGGVPKIDHAITAGLATAWAAAVGGDLVGYYAYDTRPRSFHKPEPGRLAFARLRSWTADLDYVSRETNHTLAMSELNARTPKRSLIIVFTDFIDTTSSELLVENIGILSKRHLVIFVALRDPMLEQMVGEAPNSMDETAELVAASQTVRERRLVFERLGRLGVTVLDVRPGEITARLISTYLEIKARELI